MQKYNFAPIGITTQGVEHLSCHRHSGNGCYSPKDGYLGAYPHKDTLPKTTEDWEEMYGLTLTNCSEGSGIFAQESAYDWIQRLEHQWFWIPSGLCTKLVVVVGGIKLITAERIPQTEIWNLSIEVPYGHGLPTPLARIWKFTVQI